MAYKIGTKCIPANCPYFDTPSPKKGGGGGEGAILPLPFFFAKNLSVVI